MGFANHLLAACVAKRSRVCVGIDPMPDKFPAGVTRDLDGIREFAAGVVEAVADVAACVKPQSAYFEAFGPEGVAAFFEVVAYARSLGLLVVGDAKRGDIGATSSAYAHAHLTRREAPDALTVNPMLGMDTLTPFLDAARTAGKGLFVLVRTSNPGSGVLQDVPLADGRTWCEMLADTLAPLADASVQDDVSLVGAVVGATQPHVMASLRRRLPRSIFLLPGYGAQGGTAETARAAFADGTAGAIVSASRSVTYAERFGGSWQSDVAAAARRMRDDLNNVVGVPA